MPDEFSREIVCTVLNRLNYRTVQERRNQVIFKDETTGYWITIAFENECIEWPDLAKNLLAEGITESLFLAEYESL